MLTPEQRRLDALEVEVRELRAIFTDWQERMPPPGPAADSSAAIADAIAAAQVLVESGGDSVAAYLANRSRQRYEAGDLGLRPEKVSAASQAIPLPQLLALAQRPALEPGQVAMPLKHAELYRQLHGLAEAVEGKLSDMSPSPEWAEIRGRLHGLTKVLAAMRWAGIEPPDGAPEPDRRVELYCELHRAADQWWGAFDGAEPGAVDGPDDARAKQYELACAEENLQDALAALRDAGIYPSP